MKKLIFSVVALLVGSTVLAQPVMSYEEAEAKANEILKSLTLEEKLSMTQGHNRFFFPGVPEKGLPYIYTTDASMGVKNKQHLHDAGEVILAERTTQFPAFIMLAATFNPDLAYKYGHAVGEEARMAGAGVILGPGMNIYRNARCGRNFEYLGEDPHLAASIIYDYVTGMQSTGTLACAKHFLGNQTEFYRRRSNSIIDERAIMEIYTPAFKAAIDAGVATVMTAYNQLNGEWAGESKYVITDLLRGTLGFKGMVMTDWYGGTNTKAQMIAGNDMLQPGRPTQFTDLVELMESGEIDMDIIDRNIKRILELILQSPKFKGYEYSNKPDLAAHADVTRQSATEGMVLLKNEATLPFAADVKNVALFGNTSYNFIAGGTGSGNVNRAYTVSLLDGLKNVGYVVDESLKASYDKHIAKEQARIDAAVDPNDQFAAFSPKPLPVELLPTAKQLKDMVAKNDVALITIGRTSGEFLDRYAADFVLSEEENKLIKLVCDAFHAAGKKVAVVLNIGGAIETASWKAMPDAILCAWQAGQEGGNSVADVLKGNATPSGKLTMTFPVNFQDHGSSANFPIDEVANTNIINNVKTSFDRKNVDYTVYEEGIYVGYRWFDTQNLEVSYPFGYGLSYTTFEYSNPVIAAGKNETTVTVEVKNTGAYAGKEVVQLYVSAPKGALDKPAQELKAFAKTAELQPGESQVITLVVKNEDLASFDEAQSAWVVDAGTYNFHIAASSRDIKATLAADVKGSVKKAHNVLNLQ